MNKQNFTLERPGLSRAGSLPALRSWIFILLVSLTWLLLFNIPLLRAAMAEGRSGEALTDALLLASLGGVVLCTHAALLALMGPSVMLRWAVALLTLVAASAGHFIAAYGVVLDPDMLRNVLATHPGEAKELLTASFATDLVLKGVLPAVVFLRWPLHSLSWRRGLFDRVLLLGVALLGVVVSVWMSYQPLASLMRNHRELRYLVTPTNVLWSGGVALRGDMKRAAQAREPIGLDARAGGSWAARTRPLVVVLVVVETARAANWGLNAGARDTTPQLRQLPVINFGHVVSCGTNTEVSLPCMFAPVGRRDYDEARIRGQESLLHVLNRAGVQVHWLDNQSGCKGVCDGLPFELTARTASAGCSSQGCLDDALLSGLDELLKNARGTHLRVLHMIGNHGPSYYRRYPAGFEHFQPACKDDNLHKCSVESVVNAYDNALRFTDHVLSKAIGTLQAASDRVDTALIYVSDHGESLGEKGLFLHGLPYRIAPAEQTRVPMIWWLGPGLDAAIGTPDGCTEKALRKAAQGDVAHDHLFHSLLGLMDVRTGLYEARLDVLADCRKSPR